VTYSLSLSISTWLLTILAIPTQYKRANTMKILMRFFPTIPTQLKPGTSFRVSRGAFSAKDRRTIKRISGMV
jgi:hypothetical protein